MNPWRPSLTTWLTAGGVLLMAAIGFATILVVLGYRDRAFSNSERELQNAALLLSQQISREMESLELVQLNLIEKLRREEIENDQDFTRKMSGHDFHLLLKEKIVGLPQVSAIGLINSKGELVNWSRGWPIPPIQFTDRDYFHVLAEDHSTRKFISEPVHDRGSEFWSVVLAHKLVSSSNQFLGLVSGVIELERFQSYFRTISLRETSSISLFRDDGLLLARHPYIGPAVGKKYLGLVDSLGDAVARSTRIIGRMDGKDRLLAAHRVTNSPLVVVAGLETEAALADWWEQTKFLVGVGVLSILVTAFILYVIVRKISKEHASSKQRLMSEKQRLGSTIANMPHGVCMFGPDKKLVVANELYSTMYRLNPEEAPPGTTLNAILESRIKAGSSPKDTEGYIASRLEEAFLAQPGYIINELGDGRVIAISRRPMPDGGSVAIHQDITLQKRAEEKIKHLAHYDPLTNLANRVLFLERANEAVKKCRLHGKRFAVHLLDLDQFKEVNDSLGHAFGDSLLVEVASRVRACVGPADLVARLGGDEFAVLQTIGATGSEDVASLAKELLRTIAQPYEIDSYQLMIETSIGVAFAPDHGLEAAELLKKADLALYRAKSHGRNDWQLFEPGMEEEARSRLALAMDLKNAVLREDFELHYQPVVSVVSEATVGAEALVRWQSPHRGVVGPSEFIPLAEETGQIVALGEWILQRACRDAADWPSHLSVAVNLSPAQFRGDNLVDCVERALSQSGLPPKRLELEVTESVLLQHNEHNLEILRRLQKLGIAIVLDDFGTGFSSMSYLLSFPFDRIKIDRKFVADLTRRNDCGAIVNAVSGLARSLNITTTAEGVETPEQLTLLRAAGCTFAQGYLFGRPCSNEKLHFVNHKTRVAALRA